VNETYAILEYEDGKKQRTEACFGSSFLSQNSRFFTIGTGVKKCTVYDYKGTPRIITL
jgi:hypothetical protein